jgi:exosortase F-associated protein
MNPEWQDLKINPRRTVLLILGVSGLVLIFLFQATDWLTLIQLPAHPYIHFTVNKTVRLLLNDSFVLLIIHAWFYNAAITRVAWNLQLIDTCILLPIYLILKLTLEGESEISTPLLSQLHRLIVNPTIMILYIPAVYFQRMAKNN